MEAVIQEFRTALGGFNRQDVQSYIEQLTSAYRKELAELQKRLEKAEDRSAEMGEELSSAKAAAEEGARTQEALDEANRALARLRGELSQAESKLAVARKESERLQAQVAVLEPMAASYKEMRDRAANVELDAHQRAQEAVGAARAEAERIRADTRRWLAKVLEEYGQLRQGMEDTLEQIRSLSAVPERVELLDETARRLGEQGGLKGPG